MLKQLKERLAYLEQGELQDLKLMMRMSSRIKDLELELASVCETATNSTKAIHEILIGLMEYFDLHLDESGKLNKQNGKVSKNRKNRR